MWRNPNGIKQLFGDAQRFCYSIKLRHSARKLPPKALVMRRRFYLIGFCTFSLMAVALGISAIATDLVDAVERQDWEAATQEIAAGADVSKRQADGMTALHWAVFHQRSELVEQLVASKADVNARTRYEITPLSIACSKGNPQIAEVLLEHGADANAELPGGETLLMTAARTGVVEVASTLLAHGARVNAKEKSGQTALMWAAAEGNTAVVDVLLKAGADFGVTLKSGFTALMFAAREGRIDAAKRLIHAGAYVNDIMLPNNTSGRAPREGMSPLLLAVESGHFELAMELVKLGADPNDQRSGFAPLHALTWVRKTNWGDNVDGDPPPRGSGKLTSLEFVRAVVAAGADVNLQLQAGSGGRAKLNTQGATPFLMAAKTADLPYLQLLLELGADPKLNNVDNCTPLLAAAGIGVTAVGEEAGTEPEALEAIKFLVGLGLDPNAVDKNKESVMHGVGYRNYPQTAKLLAELGADPKVWNHKNKYGWTPFMIAAGHRPGSFKPSPETIAALTAALQVNSLPRPNIVLVMADDQGWGETGYRQHPILKTPNLDAMADAGIRFDRFYAGAPVCSPTRASVMTGRSNNRTGVESHGFALRLQEKTLAQALKTAGYATGHFGKWHLNGLRGPGVPVLSSDDHHPGQFGFDEWLSVTNFFDRNPLLSRQGKFEDFQGDSSEIVIAEALKFIKSQADSGTPSFSVVWFGTPHSPFVAAEEDMQAFAGLDQQSRNHYGELVAMDRGIGNLRRTLRDLGLDQNTLVWYCSDNGGLPKIEPETVGGLRGFKGSVYEGGLRVPGIVEWSGTVKPQVTDFPAVVMDIFPTIAQLVGLPADSQIHPQDGVSLLPVFHGEKLTERGKPIPFNYSGNTALVDNNWKLIRFADKQGTDRFELYDLAIDPQESQNLYDASTPESKRMQDELLSFDRSLAESVAGKDYPEGSVNVGEPKPRSWTDVDAYRPYFDDWKNRPEYSGALKK